MANSSAYTNCIFKNSSGKLLKLHSTTIWEGLPANAPTEIVNENIDEFKHKAQNEDSVGGLLYEFGEENKFKWITAWSNPSKIKNKVYTQILEDDVVEWQKIKESLDQSGKEYKAEKLPYASDVVIDDETSHTPTMTATLYIKDSQS